MFSLRPEQIDILSKISTEISPLLKEGRVYFQEIIKTASGIEGGSLYFTEEYNLYDESFISIHKGSEFVSDINLLEKALNHLNVDLLMNNIYSNIPTYTKIRFTYEKDRSIQMTIYGVKELINDLKKEFYEVSKTEYTSDDPLLSISAFIRFEKQTDRWEKVIDYSEFSKDSIKSDSNMKGAILLDCLYSALGGKLQQLYVHFENRKIVIESIPSFSEHQIDAIAPNHYKIPLEFNYKTKKEAINYAKKIRMEFLHSIENVKYFNSRVIKT